MTTPNLDLSTTGEGIYFDTLPERHDTLHWIQEGFPPPTEWLLNPEIKLEFKSYLGLFFPFFRNILQPSTDTKEVSSWCIKAMDCGIVVSEFVLQSRYYVHFRANTLGKGMNPFILPAMG